MASLRVIPYTYVPTKRRPRNNDQRSPIDKNFDTDHVTQESQLGNLAEKATPSLIAEIPGDGRGAGEESRHDNVYEAIADEPTRPGIHYPASTPNAEVSLTGNVEKQDALDGESDYSQVEFNEYGIIDFDPPSDFDFESIFGDVDALSEEPEVSSVIKCNDGHVTNPHTDVYAGQTDHLALEEEVSNIDTSSSCSSQSTKRRTSTKRTREEDNLSVFMIGNNSDSGISDQYDDESIFEARESKRSRLGFPDCSLGVNEQHMNDGRETDETNSHPDSSAYSTDVEGVAESGKRLSTHYPVSSTDLIRRENESPAIGPGGTSNLIHDIIPKVDSGDVDSDNDDDELLHCPSWFRFSPSFAKIYSDDVFQSSARRCYVAQVRDAYRDREFHDILGKEDIDGEVHYMVDWVPTLVRGYILQKAQAQPLISSFEARCKSNKEGKWNGKGASR